MKVGDILHAGASAPYTMMPGTVVEEERRLMPERCTRNLPVLDGRALQGVISFHNTAGSVLEEGSFENRMLEAHVRDRPEPESVRE